jgi:hypothetical protein
MSLRRSPCSFQDYHARRDQRPSPRRRVCDQQHPDRRVPALARRRRRAGQAEPSEGARPLAPEPALDELFPPENRPWGDAAANEQGGAPSAQCLTRAREIFERIRKECSEALGLLRDGGLSARLAGVQVRRYYIPGNHDRLYLHDSKLAAGILEALGATPVPAALGGPHAFRSEDHGVIARHGHQWDAWNFEAHEPRQHVDEIPAEAYGLLPIGDVITTELAARLPYAVYWRLASDARTKSIADDVYEKLIAIEDVRPLHTVVQWVLDEGHRLADHLELGGAGAQGNADEVRGLVRRALDAVLKEIIGKFMEIPFVRGWQRKHTRFGHLLDEAHLLNDVGLAARLLDLDAARGVLRLYDASQKLSSGEDQVAKGAGREPLGVGTKYERIRYCVYGHTHEFRHEPLRVDARAREHVYFNSGTWRGRVGRTRDQHGFVGYKDIAYLVFYRDDEDTLKEAGQKGLSYEAWHGLMLKRPRETAKG